MREGKEKERGKLGQGWKSEKRYHMLIISDPTLHLAKDLHEWIRWDRQTGQANPILLP